MNIKSLACFSAALAASSVFADIHITIGVTEIDSPYKNTIVAVPYTGFTSGENITVSNIVKTANLNAGDLCYAMSGSDNLYNAWQLVAGSDGVKYWQTTKQVSIVNGEVKATDSPSPDSVKLPLGSALWIVRNSGDYSNSIYLWGTYSGSAPASTVNSSVDGVCNMVANAGSSAKTIQEIIDCAGMKDKWVKGDRITITPNNDSDVGAAYNGYFWTGNTSLSIDPGMGCWILKHDDGSTSGAGTIQW